MHIYNTSESKSKSAAGNENKFSSKLEFLASAPHVSVCPKTTRKGKVVVIYIRDDRGQCFAIRPPRERDDNLDFVYVYREEGERERQSVELLASAVTKRRQVATAAAAAAEDRFVA